MKISFLGATGTVTGSCFLVEHKNTTFLVDCGLYQGNKELKERNYVSFMFPPEKIDFVLLTHAHIDHSGLLPKLYKEGFHGNIYTTNGTYDLCTVMLPDSAHVQEGEIERKNRKNARAGIPLLEPIYTVEDAEETCEHIIAKDYWEPFCPTPDVEISFQDAGHILGSAMATVKYYNEEGKAEKIIFTGDLGRYDHFIVKDPTPINEADYIVMETTYGNRLHNERYIDTEARRRQLAHIITSTFQAGGNVIIPAFAVDRCQDIIMEINGLIDDGLLPKTKVYVDSPLAVQATEIFSRHPECFDQNTRALMKKYGRSPLKTDNIVFSTTLEQSIAINQIKSGAIVISASGMAEAGRIKHHLKHNLWRPECTVIFAGYQAVGTLGRRLIDGEKVVKIHGEEINVKAKILFMEGYSAHADRDELIQWLGTAKQKPKAVFLVHGEDDARADFKKLVEDTYGYHTIIPTWGEVFNLEAKKTTVEVAGTIKPKVPEVVLSQLYFDINQQLSDLVRHHDIDSLQAINEVLQDINKERAKGA